jgi:hypothetical protein
MHSLGERSSRPRVEKAERSGTDLLPTVEAGKEIRQAQRCDADVRREDLERYAMLYRTGFYVGTCLGPFCKAQSDRQILVSTRAGSLSQR